MKSKTVVDRMNNEKFLGLVNDPLFTGGLSEAINMTRARKYETGFTMYRSPSEDQTFFDEDIEIGDSESIGRYYRHSKLEAEFEKKYGRAPSFPRPSEGRELTIEEINKANEKRSEYYGRFKEYLESKEEEFEVIFPNLPRKRSQIHSCHFPDVYKLVEVHTHPILDDPIFVPYSPIYPSPNDMERLWQIKRDTLKEEIIEEAFFHKPKLIAPVFSMIAGTGPRNWKNKDSYQLGLVVNHKDKTTRGDVDESFNQFSRLWKVRYDRGFATNDAYSFAIGTFDPKKMRVQFEPSSLDVMLEESLNEK